MVLFVTQRFASVPLWPYRMYAYATQVEPSDKTQFCLELRECRGRTRPARLETRRFGAAEDGRQGAVVHVPAGVDGENGSCVGRRLDGVGHAGEGEGGKGGCEAEKSDVHAAGGFSKLDLAGYLSVATGESGARSPCFCFQK